MNRQTSQLIGMMLLALLFTTYVQYFSPIKKQPASKPVPTQSAIKDPFSQIKNLLQPPPTSSDSLSDENIVLENENVRILLDQKGGMIKKVILKKYHKHDQPSLNLVEESNNHMAWLLNSEDSMLNTKDLHFQVNHHHNQVILTHTLDAEKNQYIQYIYTLPQKSYVLDYKVKISGLHTSSEKAHFAWYYLAKNLETDYNLNKRYTYTQYQLKNKKLKYLNKSKEVALQNVNWLALHQRFFTAGISAPHDTPFSKGELITQPALTKDQNTLMEMGAKLEIPLTKLDKGANFKFYFGPNSYKELAQVAPGFEKNHYLGWPVIKQINKYIIVPLADFLHKYTNHYIWVLLLLALLFRLLQLYFSYKDHIITLKQKALKPAIQELTAKYKDKQQARLAEMSFYTQMGLPPSFIFFKLFAALVELPVFIAMMHFIPSQIALRHVPFLWVKDLSSADNFIQLPFHIPLLGSHISLFALFMCLSFLLRSTNQEQPASADINAKLLKYIFPIFMFLGFNSYPAAFCIYRIFVNLLNLLTPLLFKLLIDEAFHLSQIKKKQEEVPVAKNDLPRSLSRLEKKRNKK